MNTARARVILTAILCSTTAAAFAQVTDSQRVPAHIGSPACAACHEVEASAWRDSDHARAWLTPEPQNVLGDFSDTTFTHNGITSRFTTRDGRFFVRTDGADGTLTDFEVKYTAGIVPLQQYLVETAPGRLQQLDTAWDTEEERWFHVYPEQDLPHTSGLHWTGPYKNWNARCAECHATDFRKNYKPRTKTYASTWAEIGVGCEACHGPGEAHAAWARDSGSFDAAIWDGVDQYGITFAFDPAKPEVEIQQCAGCHSRREPIGDASPAVGTPFADAYRLAVLRESLYHPDGQILDEVYVYGSFLQSSMYARGVRCSDCHDVHSGAVKAAGNAVCTQCHSEAGNSEFPTLKRADYDGPEHHFHATGTAAAQCVSCHMPERLYMVVDGRRDHSFRVPRPDLSVEIAVPNACTDCHKARTPVWAAKQVQRWYPNGRSGQPHYGQVIARARNHVDNRVHGDLVALALDERQTGIVRATALGLLAAAPSAMAADRTAPLLGDSDPLVRGAAVGIQRGARPTRRVQRLVPLLEDPMRSVRLAAAREFLDAPAASLRGRIADAAGKALREWRASLLAKADFPETHIVLGGAALVTRDPRAAEAAFREAVRLDPQRVEAWQMIVRIRAALGDRDGARNTLEDALAVNPDDAVLQSAREQFEATGTQ